MGKHLRVSIAILPLVLLVACQQGDTNVEKERVATPAAGQDAPVAESNGEDRPEQGDTRVIGTVRTVGGEPIASGVDVSLVPTMAPDFSWRGHDGGEGSLSDYRGSVVLLNFWGTWCPPCRRELPDIVRLRQEFSERGFEVLGLSLNERPQNGMSIPEHLAAFADANGIAYPLLIANPDVVSAYGSPPSVPTTFIIDRSGKIASVLVGARTEAEFRSVIEPLL